MKNIDILSIVIFQKEAAPAWAKMLGNGKLSPSAMDKLKGAIPLNKTRQIPKTTPGGQVLGRGLEGMVVPSFTGGQGPSATKLMFQRLDSDKVFPKHPAAGKVTGQVDETLNYTTPVGVRAQVMSQYPTVFPKIYNTVKGKGGDLGYTMERLSEIDPAHAGFKKMMQLHNANVANSTYARVARSPTTSNRTLSNESIRTLYAQLHALRNTRNTIRRDNDPHLTAVRNLAKNLRQMSLLPKTPATEPLTTKALRFNSPTHGNMEVRDFGFSSAPGAKINYHNMMKANDGRFVISDPDISPAYSFAKNSPYSAISNTNAATTVL